MIPTPYTVQHSRYRPGALTRHGNPIDEWDEPTGLQVHGWGPASSDTTTETHRTPTVTRIDLYAPAGTTVHARDRIIIGNDTYNVDGTPADYSHGPWQWRGAGVVIHLEKVEG